MLRLLWTASLLLLTGAALAQDAPGDQALRFSVRPTGIDREASEAIERQDRLLKRLERSDHMVRSICINCGDAWKHQIYAPFDPYAALGRPIQPSPVQPSPVQPSEEAGN